MTQTKDFKRGDRVYHIGRDEFGIVTSTANDVVVVEFSRAAPRGGRSIGEFDEVWFNTHPDWLSKRTPARQAPAV